MLIIEIHVDKHENKTASTHATRNRQDAPYRSTPNATNWHSQFVETIKNWLATLFDYNRNNNGF
jgi:hypothetical protein